MPTPYPTTPEAIREPLLVRAADAERVALSAGSAFHLLADGGGSGADAPGGGAFGVNRLVLAEGADGARPHYHARSAELFYVLGGVAEFLLGDRSRVAAVGDLVVVPPGLPHAFGAAPGRTVALLVVMSPAVERFGYFRHLGRVAAGLDTFDRLLPEQDRYDVHFTDPALWQQARSRA
ncbi:cupin domain-containing protein [Kitasatospora sp. NBC_01246]|uniref:cupin domain-containing protein n=1 Tax=Kitasatospora sp. NBC_01246 TaxID=2903570 RepID=UPI002E3526F9|nr:cupin domain-containing protein [Kitasatospora sp. NBC_01246]